MNGTQMDGVACPAARAGEHEPAGVRLRPVRAADADALQQFVGALSLRSRYLRFFAGVPRVSPAALRRMMGMGAHAGEHVDALVAVEDGVIIAHGMATGTKSPSGTTVTEIGVVVADRWQRQGVGSALTHALARRAQARGATVLIMDVLAENHAMLALIRRHFPAAHSCYAGPAITVHVPLPLTQEEPPRESPPLATRQRQLTGTS